MSKAKRPNRIYGRQKDKQIHDLKQQQEERRQAYIKKMQDEKTYDGRSIFDFVSENKNISYSVLTIIAVLAFVVGPAYYAAIQGGPSSGPVAGAGELLASWDYGEITRGEANRMQEEGQRLQLFYSALVTNAVSYKTKDYLQGDSPDFDAFRQAQTKQTLVADPWQISVAPSDPITVKFLSSIADKHGMGITKEEILKHIDENLYQYNSTKQISKAKEDAFGEPITKEEIAEKLVPYIAARKVQRLADSGIPTTPNISDRAVTHQMVTEKHQFEILELPVKPEDAGTPTEAELEQQLSNLREVFLDETGLNPLTGFQINNQTYYGLGVRTPRKFGYQYVAFDEDAYDRLAQVQLEAKVTEAELLNYYETNIEQYVKPDDVFDELEKEATEQTEETNAGEAGSNDAENTDTTESEDSKNLNSNSDDSANEEKTSDDNVENNDDCLNFFQEESDSPQEDTTEQAASAAEAPEANGENATENIEGREESSAPAEEQQEDTPEVEDLTGLDTPIPLEPNIIPEPQKTYKPYEEVKEDVREAYIRTSKFEEKRKLLEAHKARLSKAMNAFADGDSGNEQARSIRIADALDQGNLEEAEKIKQEAAAELARVVAEINADAEGVLTEVPEKAGDEESAKAVQIVLAVTGDTAHTTSGSNPDKKSASVISAAYGQAISGRNPDAEDFGLPWDDSTPSWVKLVRIAYQAHGGSGSAPDSNLFLESDFLIPHETDALQNHSYVFWQVEQTNETPFDAGLENEELRANVLSSWQKTTALKNLQDKAKRLVETIPSGDNAVSLTEALNTEDIGESPTVYTTFPTSTFRLSQFNFQGGGIELGTLQKFEVVTSMVDAPIPDTPDEEGDQTSADDSKAEATDEPATEDSSDEESTETPDQIERKELRPTDTISDISDVNKMAMFEQMEVNTSMSFTSSTGRVVYIIRKIEYSPSSEAPSLPADFFAPTSFDSLVQYLADGRVPGTPGIGSLTIGPTATATDNLYRSPQGGGTVTQLSRGFIALLQKQYNYQVPEQAEQ